jgi:hypothetical protein
MDLLKKLVTQQREVFDGFLAEDYDGRSQYILVSLSRGSSSAAQARSLVPHTSSAEAGSPVKLKSLNGKIYIVSFGGRVSRICDQFERIADEVIIDHVNISDEDDIEVWDGDDVIWTGQTGHAGAKYGVDSQGAYIGGVVNADARILEDSVIIDFPCTFYFRYKSNVAYSSLPYYILLSTEGPDSYGLENPAYAGQPDLDSYVGYIVVQVALRTAQVDLSVDTAQIDGTLNATAVAAIDQVVNEWRWIAVDYNPGVSVEVRTWKDTEVEPDTAIISLDSSEDNAYIPLSLTRIWLSQQTAVFGIGNANNKVWFSRFCIDDDISPVIASEIVQSKLGAWGSSGIAQTTSFDLQPTAGNTLLAFMFCHDEAQTGNPIIDSAGWSQLINVQDGEAGNKTGKIRIWSKVAGPSETKDVHMPAYGGGHLHILHLFEVTGVVTSVGSNKDEIIPNSGTIIGPTLSPLGTETYGLMLHGSMGSTGDVDGPVTLVPVSPSIQDYYIRHPTHRPVTLTAHLNIDLPDTSYTPQATYTGFYNGGYAWLAAAVIIEPG